MKKIEIWKLSYDYVNKNNKWDCLIAYRKNAVFLLKFERILLNLLKQKRQKVDILKQEIGICIAIVDLMSFLLIVVFVSFSF